MLFMVGYLLPLAACLLIWKGTFIDIIFSGYGTQSAAEAGRDVSIRAFVNHYFSFLIYVCTMILPMTLLGILSIKRAKEQGHIWTLLFAYCGVLGFSLQFFIVAGLHYVLYLVPFACLILTEILTIQDAKWLQYVKYALVLWLILLTTYKVYYNRVYKLYYKSAHFRTEQYQLATTLQDYVTPDQTLYIIHGGLYSLTLTMPNLPPNLDRYGYAFGPLGINEEGRRQQIESADWVIRYSADYEYESSFTDDLKHLLEQYEAIPLKDSTILLHNMHRPSQ